MDQNPVDGGVSPKQQIVERIRGATNVLVTVRSNPSVDELAACIGFTLMLNKLGKHATAVFSGLIPSTIEFLKPEETLETNTDSLRDFIISLDKSKADKLRYKVEENVVRIFITPYRTSITQDDLEFTQGDFNVDVVVALGVTQREELDQAITAHGRILHDAAVVTITAGQRESTLGAVNWQDMAASSLSEMLVSVSEAFQGGLIDAQMATAFLTGIVAETERFSNPKTSPKVMTMAAQLMAAGANQQLIANELQKAEPPAPAIPQEVPSGESPKQEDGALDINHEEEKPQDQPPQPDTPPAPMEPPAELPMTAEQPADPNTDNAFQPMLEPGPTEQMPDVKEGEIHIDDDGNLMRHDELKPRKKVIEPLPAEPEQPVQPPEPPQPPFSSLTDEQPAPETNVDPLTSSLPPPPLPAEPKADVIMPDPGFTPPAGELPHVASIPAMPLSQPDDATLLDIEKSVHSPHIDSAEGVDTARSAVENAIAQAGFDPQHPEPRADVGAQFGPPIQPQPPMVQPDSILPPPPQQEDGTPPPPPVPPPLMPQQ